MIKLNKVNKFYNYRKSNQLCVVDDMTLELPSKGMVAFFGKSGCGKTTLLNLIGGLDNFQSGQIEIENKVLSRKNKDAIRNEQVGYIFQNYNLDHNKTVAENVAMSLTLMGVEDKEVINQRVEVALTNVDMIKYAKRLPGTLSGGQQQRVAIARALVKSPAIILADEPTGNLDEANTLKVMQILRKMANSTLVLLVTHEEDLVRAFCDRVINLVDGKIVEDSLNEKNSANATNDKRTIYLGDYEKNTITDSSLNLEVYGDEDVSASLQIIRRNGKIFIHSSSPKVQFIDSSSEIKIKNTKSASVVNCAEEDSNYQTLPPIAYKKGKLYSFKQSFMQGVEVNFRHSRFMRKSFMSLMILFSFIAILLCSQMTAKIYQYQSRDAILDKNVIGVDIKNQEQLDKFYSKIDTVAGVKSYYSKLSNYNSYKQATNINLVFNMNNSRAYGSIKQGILINSSDAPSEYLYGRKVEKDNEVVISEKIAKDIIGDPQVSFLTNSVQLMAMKLNIDVLFGDSIFKIVGIVKDNSNFCYVTENVLYESFLKQSLYSKGPINKASSMTKVYDKEINSGEVVVYDPDNINNSLKVGDYYLIGNKEFMVKDIIRGDGEAPIEEDLSVSVKKKSYVTLTTFIINDEDYYSLLKVFLQADTQIMINCSDVNAVKSALQGSFEIVDEKACREAMRQLEFEDVFVYILLFVIDFIIMLVCIAFTMRASLMPRVKEIGVLRAIGASNKDIIRNFAIETFAVIVCTILIGFILAVSFIWGSTLKFEIIKSLFYLPVWLSFVMLLLLGGSSLLCGLIPVYGISKKTPAEILAKYDV